METKLESEVREIISDFKRRAAMRAPLDAAWKLNYEFVRGKQFSRVGADLSVSESVRDFYWQQRTVYNHIAPTVEARLARLSKVRPAMSVRPVSSSEEDVKAAQLSSRILSGVSSKLGIDERIGEGTLWSEITGTVFYKVIWDGTAGDEIARENGESVRSGEVRVEVCPPYEIYPASLDVADVESQRSIIQAKYMPVSEIFERWGEAVEPSEGECALVIERYLRPSASRPDGELAIVAGDKLVYKGDLPYILGEDGERGFPFIKQDCLKTAGSFFGTSVVERLIPIQRAYNSVKNRKHEFLNRLAMGVLAVEDGSVDIDNLEEEGLSPGKILVYRMGSNPPKFMDGGSVPEEFNDEEEKLLSEFVTVSGVSEIFSSAAVASRVTSGTALKLLIEQEEERINLSAQNIRAALMKISKYVLRLYKQFAKGTRLTRLIGRGECAELIKWKNSELGSDDVIFEASEQLTSSAKRDLLLETVSAGLFNGSDGSLSTEVKGKLLEILGFGGWEFFEKNGKKEKQLLDNAGKEAVYDSKKPYKEKKN